MRLPPPPGDLRPKLLLAMLVLLAVGLAALTATLVARATIRDPAYAAEMRRTLQKYGAASQVPPASVTWLARVHEQAREQVLADLEELGGLASSFDPEAPGWEEAGLFARLFLEWGFEGVWMLFFCGGMAVTAPGSIYMAARRGS